MRPYFEIKSTDAEFYELQLFKFSGVWGRTATALFRDGEGTRYLAATTDCVNWIAHIFPSIATEKEEPISVKFSLASASPSYCLTGRVSSSVENKSNGPKSDMLVEELYRWVGRPEIHTEYVSFQIEGSSEIHRGYHATCAVPGTRIVMNLFYDEKVTRMWQHKEVEKWATRYPTLLEINLTRSRHERMRHVGIAGAVVMTGNIPVITSYHELKPQSHSTPQVVVSDASRSMRSRTGLWVWDPEYREWTLLHFDTEALDALGGTKEDLTTREGVVSYMTASTSAHDWIHRAHTVRTIYGGMPEFWHRQIQMSGLCAKKHDEFNSN